MKKALWIVAGLAALSFVPTLPVLAADQPAAHSEHGDKVDGTRVKGKIDKVDGKTITVGEQSFKIDDKTEILIGKKTGTATDLTVGENINATVKDGVATKVVVVKARKAAK